jgi:ubiquinone/menaquinone biosynthesis C-methylase UbiE
MNWNDFARYYDWEFAMICTRQALDVPFWQRMASQYGSPVLEVCCGSGRITLPVAKAGHQVVALDYSSALLDAMKSKMGALPITPVQADMRSFSLDARFPFAFISYSSFQQLLTLDDQMQCLRTIHRHLQPGGVLALDLTPCMCEGPDELPLTRQYSEFFAPARSQVTMYTSYRIDRLNLIKHWHDEYQERLPDGTVRRFEHSISLRECSQDYMRLLLEACGYQLEVVWGDFEEGPLTADSNNMIVVAQKK